MDDSRSTIPAAAQAALWAMSNGTCYAPGCPFPVVHEVRPGVYRKNVQIAHIFGVKGPRKDPSLQPAQREMFWNLLLLCLAHHSEVDDRKYGAKLYPPEVLRRWKADREGSNGPILDPLTPENEEAFLDYLAEIFEPPVQRLEAIADQLERTGTLNAQSVADLRQTVKLLGDSPANVNHQAASALANAAELLAALNLDRVAMDLTNAADALVNVRSAPRDNDW